MEAPLPASVRREPSMKIRVRRLVQSVQQVETDIPVLRKFLCCLPLRVGLYTWGILLLLAITSITIQAFLHYGEILVFRHRMSQFGYIQLCLMYIITMLVTLVEFVFTIMLLVGIKRNSISILTTVYRYCMVKIFTYGALLLVCYITKHVAVSYLWFDRNVDPVRNFLLYESPQVGLIDFLLQIYMTIVLRSYMIQRLGDSQPVFHIPTPIVSPTIPYSALPKIIDPKDMFKY